MSGYGHYEVFRRIMRAARATMPHDAKRADPGAYTAHCLLAAKGAYEGILAAGWHVDSVEVENGELVAYVHGTPVVAVAV